MRIIKSMQCLKMRPSGRSSDPVVTRVPLNLSKGMRIGLVGNTLFDRMRDFGHFEALLQLGHPDHKLVLRNLAWSADEIDLQPRPADFADAEQHLVAMKADLILAAFGFNEAFGGNEALPSFEIRLAKYLQDLKSKAYNGKTSAKIVLVSPIANENVKGVSAADLNNRTLQSYVKAMAELLNGKRSDSLIALIKPRLVKRTQF